jgi:CBS domain containing-hemolysin-like protein
MVCLDVQDTFAENLDKALSEELTRYPVCDDDKDNIIGFVHVKDILKEVAKGENPNLREMVREVTAVPETMHISDLLKVLQKNRTQMAIVVDEYGGTAGLVTVEDILEEIVGEIEDEFDEDRSWIEMQDNNTYSVDARIQLDEFNEFFELQLETEEVDTFGGWICLHTELPPKVNSKIEYNEYEFIITEADHMRVNRVLVRKNREPLMADDQASI